MSGGVLSRVVAVVAARPMRWLAHIKRRNSEAERALTEARRTLEAHQRMMARARSLEVRVDLHGR